MAHWNYRVLELPTPDGGRQREIVEMFYDDDGKPNGWTEASLTWEADDPNTAQFMLGSMLVALAKPILTEADFPGWEPK